MAHVEKLSVEALTNMLIQGKVDVNELNLAYANQRNAFLAAIEKRPHILKNVLKANASHFIPAALKHNAEYFLYLDKEQYEDEFIQTYLNWRLTKDKAPAVNRDGTPVKKNFLVNQSYDKKMVFQYNYSTPETDELYYSDSELKIPLSIRSSFKIRMKLVKPIEFLEQIDLDVASLGENKIKSTLADMISSKYKAYLHEFIRKNNVGYYSLCVSVNEIEEGFVDRIEKDLRKYGLQVTDFVIKSLAIPKEIQNRVEDLAFQIRQQNAEAEASSHLAQIALDNYKTKLELEEKFPTANHTLTEYEKDLALKRYLVKHGRDVQEEVDRSIKVAAATEVQDTAILKEDDKLPEIEPKKNKFKSTFITLLVLCLIFDFIMFVSNGVRTGFIILSIITLVFGLIAAFNREKFKDVPVQMDDDGDDGHVGE